MDAEWAKLREEQRDLRVKIAETNSNAAIAAKNDIYQLVHGLFRNTEFKKNLRDTYPVPTYQSGTQSSYVQNYDVTKETKSEAV